MTQSPQTAASANMLSANAAAAANQRAMAAERAEQMKMMKTFENYVRRSDELLSRKLADGKDSNWQVLNEYFDSTALPELTDEETTAAFDVGMQTVRVTKVIDGDTFHTADGLKVRLFGVDTPETQEAYGVEQEHGKTATRFLKQLIEGRNVAIAVLGRTDKHGRVVAWVAKPNGESINTEMLYRGLGWWDHRFAGKADTLKAAEHMAKCLGRGVHAGRSVPPWEFRRANKPGAFSGLTP